MEITSQVKEASKQTIERVAENKSRMRELMTTVMASNWDVEEISIIQDENTYSGYVEFYVPVESMGLNAESTKKFKREIFTGMFVDFVVELAVRENMEAFLNKLSAIQLSDYTNVIGNRRHETAGMCIKGDSFVFTFHLSLLQDILVSDFKKKA